MRVQIPCDIEPSSSCKETVRWLVLLLVRLFPPELRFEVERFDCRLWVRVAIDSSLPGIS